MNRYLTLLLLAFGTLARADVTPPSGTRPSFGHQNFNRANIYKVRKLYLADGSGNTMSVSAPELANDSYDWVFPSSDGSANQCLVTDGNENLSWTDVLRPAATQTVTNKTISGTSNTLTVRLANDVTGTLPIANGGTGQTSQASAFDALAPTTSKGDIIARSSSSNVRVAAGTDGHVLTADSSQAAGVKWASPTAGALPSGIVAAYPGSTPPTGWLACDGSAVSQATYSELFAAIGTAYNTQINPTTGSAYSAPSAGTFRVPDYRGVFLRGVGMANTTVATTLGGWQDQKTAKNGLALTGTAASLSGSAPSLTGTTSFASTSHVHGSSGMRALFGQLAGTVISWVERGGTFGGSKSASLSSFNHSQGGASGTAIEGNTNGPNDTAAVGIQNGSYSLSGGSYSLGNGDTETRPVNVGVNYIIKI